MDNLTHSLIGYGLGEAGLRQRLGAGTTLALVVGSNLPDVDVVALFTGPGAFLLRRGWTHSVLGMPLLALACAALMRRAYPALGTLRLFLLLLGSMGLHVACDLLNSYGVRALLPFSDARFELGWVFIVDLWLWALLAVPLLWARGRSDGYVGLHAFAISAALVYILGLGALRTRADAALTRERPAAFTYTFPEAFSPLTYRGVARTGDRWETFQIDALSGALAPGRTFATSESDPAVQKLKDLPFVRRLDAFYKAPVWEPAGRGYRVFDLRFVSPKLPSRLSHAFVFDERGLAGGGVVPTMELDAAKRPE